MEMSYVDRTFAGLLKKEVVVIDKDVAPENKEKFISAVKRIIDEGIDRANDVVIEFSSDYKKVYKRSTFQSMSVKQWAKMVR